MKAGFGHDVCFDGGAIAGEGHCIGASAEMVTTGERYREWLVADAVDIGVVKGIGVEESVGGSRIEKRRS